MWRKDIHKSLRHEKAQATGLGKDGCVLQALLSGKDNGFPCKGWPG
jgi:hypothetical protein